MGEQYDGPMLAKRIHQLESRLHSSSERVKELEAELAEADEVLAELRGQNGRIAKEAMDFNASLKKSLELGDGLYRCLEPMEECRHLDDWDAFRKEQGETK